jgi:hypothetical protein
MRKETCADPVEYPPAGAMVAVTEQIPVPLTTAVPVESLPDTVQIELSALVQVAAPELSLVSVIETLALAE